MVIGVTGADGESPQIVSAAQTAVLKENGLATTLLHLMGAILAQGLISNARA